MSIPRNGVRRNAGGDEVVMGSGGRRSRSGPQADPNSGRSDRRGYVVSSLPAEGYSGEVPPFAIPGGEGRELDVWDEAWSTPQACAWSLEAWRWPVIAEYCRIKAVIEAEPAKSASLIDKLRMYRDQIGLTPDGLKNNGWAIAPVVESKPTMVADVSSAAPVRRLRAVGE